MEATLNFFRSRWGSGSAWMAFYHHISDRAAAKQCFARYERYACTPAGVVEIMKCN